MRLLADENVARAVVHSLRARGHDVAWVHEDAPGSDDPTVLARAQAENRVLLTFDKDFGDLAVRRGMPAQVGILLVRLAAPTPARVAEVLGRVLDSRDDWADHFSVVEDDRVRMMRLPTRR